MKKRWQTGKEVVLSVSAALRRAQVGVYSAQAAYFVFFSAIPTLMLLLAAVNLFFPDLPQSIMDAIGSQQTIITPDMLDRFMEAGKVVVPTSAVVVLWSASRGIRAIGEGISSVYQSEFGKKNLLVRYLYSFLYTLIFLGSVLLTLGFVVFGRYLVSFFKKIAPSLVGFLETLFGLRILISAVVLIGFFVLFYKLLGPSDMKLKGHLPGAVFAGGGWVLFSFLFALYLKYFSGWQSVYGSLSVVMILLLWVYGCMYILMLGALFNTYLSKRPRVV